MELGLVLSKALEEKEIDATNYRRNIGCLRYLLHTRPDLAFSVGVLSRFMHSPRESHGNALKQCLRYLRGFIGMQEVTTTDSKFKRENVGINLE